jgi:hypothetical protein
VAAFSTDLVQLQWKILPSKHITVGFYAAIFRGLRETIQTAGIPELQNSLTPTNFLNTQDFSLLASIWTIQL